MKSSIKKEKKLNKKAVHERTKDRQIDRKTEMRRMVANTLVNQT